MIPDTSSVLSHFSRIAAIPRPSKQESALTDFLAAWFAERGAAVERDAAGNLRADCAPPGADPSSPPVILQAHLDMVCAVAPGVAADPAVQGVVPVRDGDLLRASGTSLGADDGIGIALAMALFAAPPPGSPPLRAVFTADEESGMSGARALSPSWLAPARCLLNLDWEEAFQFCTASAASQTFELSAAFQPRPPENNDLDWFELRLEGPDYPGGHSGSDIHLGIPHPGLDLMAAMNFPWLCGALSEFRCGHAPNAIPTSATALVGIHRNRVPLFLNTAPPGLESTPVPPPPVAVPENRLIDFDYFSGHLQQNIIHPGADPAVPDCSVNVGLIDFSPASFRLVSHVRSRGGAHLDEMRKFYADMARTSCSSLKTHPVAPGWVLPPTSPILAQALAVAADATGRTWTPTATHAGLECGIFAEKAPGLPMLSFGPSIHHPHTPAETLDLSTLPPLLAFLRSFLPSLA